MKSLSFFSSPMDVDDSKTPALPHAELLKRLGVTRETAFVVRTYIQLRDERKAHHKRRMATALDPVLDSELPYTTERYDVEAAALTRAQELHRDACDLERRHRATMMLALHNEAPWVHSLDETRRLLLAYYRDHPRPCTTAHGIIRYVNAADVVDLAELIADIVDWGQ